MKSKKKLFLIGAVLLLISAGLFCFFFFFGTTLHNQRLLKETSYNALVLTTPVCRALPEDRIASDFGTEPLKLTMKDGSPKEISKLLKTAFTVCPDMSVVFIELRPDHQKSPQLADFISIVNTHPDTLFFLFYQPRSDTELQSLDRADADAYLQWSLQLCSLSNVKLHYYDDEAWMRENPYFFREKEISADGMFYVFSAFVGGRYLLDAANAEERLQAGFTVGDAVQYPDWHNETIFCFGDSILGKDQDESGVLNLVAGYTGATVYNYAIGGSLASGDHENDFSNVVAQHLADASSTLQPSTIIIAYGYNDYAQLAALTGTADSFAESLKRNIRLLQQRYPDARIILCSPMMCSFGEGGDIPLKNGYALGDYAETASAVAAELNLTYLNNFMTEEFTASTIDNYLSDGLHLNERGRYLQAQRIMRVLQ